MLDSPLLVLVALLWSTASVVVNVNSFLTGRRDMIMGLSGKTLSAAEKILVYRHDYLTTAAGVILFLLPVYALYFYTLWEANLPLWPSKSLLACAAVALLLIFLCSTLWDWWALRLYEMEDRVKGRAASDLSGGVPAPGYPPAPRRL